MGSAFWGAVLGGLVASLIVAYLTQRWIEKRERRNRRDELRLELYLDIVDLILDNERELAERTEEGKTPTVDLQLKRISISHRLMLLGSPHVKEAFKQYRDLIFTRTVPPLGAREASDHQATVARDNLIKAMVNDVQNEPSIPPT